MHLQYRYPSPCLLVRTAPVLVYRYLYRYAPVLVLHSTSIVWKEATEQRTVPSRSRRPAWCDGSGTSTGTVQAQYLYVLARNVPVPYGTSIKYRYSCVWRERSQSCGRRRTHAGPFSWFVVRGRSRTVVYVRRTSTVHCTVRELGSLQAGRENAFIRRLRR